MVLVVEARAARKMFHEKASEFVIALFVGHHPVAREDSFGVGIDDEAGFFSGVEQDGIRRLRSDAVHREKLFTQPKAFLLKHLSQAAAVPLIEKGEEVFKPAGLHIEVACRLDEAGELFVRQAA